MKRILLFMLTILTLAFATTPLSAQNTLTVANGTTTNSYVPVYGYYADAYLRAQIVYPESMLVDMQNNAISEMTFYLSSSPSWTATFDVKIGISTDSSLSDFSSAQTTTVYSGTMPIQNSEMTLSLETPFTYTGGHLLVEFVTVNTGNYSSASFYGISSNGSSVQGYSYSGVSSISASQRNFIPKTTFSYGTPSLCSKPMNVTATNITTTTATISWVGDSDAASYTVAYMPASESDWANALTATATDTTIDLSGLTPSTFYKARVQTSCSDNTETNWSSVCNFATACEAITITTAWVEDFEGYTGSGEHSFNCWATPVSTPGGGPFVYCDYGNAAHSGGNSAELKGSNNMLVLPEFTNDIHELRLSFWATAVTPSNGTLEIGVLPDMDDLTSFEVVATAGTPGPRGSSAGGNGNFMGPFYFGNVTATSGRIALRYSSSYGTSNSWNLDDFTVDMAPLCSEISNLQVSDVYGTNASLSWNPTVVGDVLEYNIYVYDPVTETENVYTTSDTTYTIMGLNELTTYTVGVFTTCATSTSDTVFTSFMTPCNSPVNVTVGDGSSTTYLFPTYSCYNYSYTQQIIPASQLGSDPADFASLFFQCTSVVSASRNWNIYAALLPNDTNLSAGWILPSATIPFKLIHSGAVTISSTGTDNWFEVALDTVLAYDGTSNLLLSFQDMTGSYNCSNYYKYHSDATTTDMSRYAYRDDAAYNYTNPDEAGYVSSYINNIRFTFCDQSTCIRPNTLVASNVTETSADITWVSAGAESSWELEYKAADDTAWTSEGTISATNHTLSNLTANTQYTVRVRALCGADDISMWSEPISFRTECGPIATIPYSENFEDASAIYSTSQDNYYLCWNRYASNPEHFVYVSGSSSYAHGGSHFLDFHHTTNCYNIAIMPAIDQSIAISTLMVNFWACRTGATGMLEVGIMSDYADASTFEPVDTIDLSAATTYQYVEQYVKFENYQGTGQYVAFRVSNATSCGYYIDDVVLDFSPECSEINSLEVSEVTGTSALISWTDGPFGTIDSYTLEYSLAGEENWNPVTVDTTSYLLGNLEPSTYYDIRVMVNCDGSLNSEYVTTTFHTACLVGGDVTIGDGTEAFSYLPSYSLYNYSYTQQLFLSSELGGPKDIESVTFDMVNYSVNRTYKIYLMHTAATDAGSWIPATTAQLVFDAPQQLVQGLNTFQFSTPFHYNGSDNLLLIVMDMTGSWSSGNTWKTHTVPFTASRYIYQDASAYSTSATPSSGTSNTTSNRNNVIFGAGCDTTTSCVAPHINIASVSQTSATINWVAGYQENAWEMEYRLQSDTVWTSVGTVTSMSEVINGLTPNTTYVVRMRSDCGGEYSYWTESSFTTECGALTVTATTPWTEGFEGYTGTNPISLVCWATPATYTADNGIFPAIWGNWAASCHTGVNSVEMKGTNNVLVLPEFTNNLQELRLSFWATTTSTSNYGTMEVGVLTDPTDTSTFVVLGPAGVPGPRNSSSSISGNGNFMGPFDFNNIQATTGRIALRFMHTASGVSWNLDDFTVELIPDCPSPVKNSVTATNVDGHNATISFTDNDPDHSSWTVYYKPSTNTTWSSVVINTTTTTLTNLDPETTYDVYVVTNCSTPSQVEDATITIHFTTLVACPAPTGITASNVGMTSATISWQGNADSYNITCGTDNLTSTTNSIELTGLTAGTSYTVTVVADCGTADGTSAPATFTFTTALCEVANQCAYTFVLTDTYGDGWNGGSLAVQQGSNIVATLEALHHGGGSVMSYDTVIVNLCDNQSTSLVWSAGSYTSEPGFTLIAPDGTQAYTISGMTNYTTYTFTTDCGGSGPVVTNPTVATNAANPVAQTTATLNATITNPDEVTISAKGFEWKTTMGGNYAPVAGTGTGNTFTANLTNLTPNTSYTFKAFITYNGTTVYGDEMTFTTDEQQQETCPAPTGLTATVDHTDVTLTWQQEPNTATEWQINYRLATESNWSTVTATSTTYTLTDLTANAQYVANVVAHCTNGLTSDESNTVTFETNNIGVEDYLSKAVTLYPNPATEMVSVAVSDANIMITGVEVYNVYGQLINTIVSTENPLRINVSGLADGMYYVRVTTDNGVVTKNFVKR